MYQVLSRINHAIPWYYLRDSAPASVLELSGGFPGLAQFKELRSGTVAHNTFCVGHGPMSFSAHTHLCSVNMSGIRPTA